MSRRIAISRVSLFAAALALSTAAFAENTYQQDRARCMDGSSGQDQQTCLREMGAAAQERRRNGLTEAESYEQNRVARCDTHKDPQERDYCLRRMRGEGTVSGSVKGGGLMRELTVVVPANPQ